MSDVNTTLNAMQAWSARAHEQGWLPDTVHAAILNHTPHDPTTLFADGAVSPLVLAFFGGTGVGKSSLLNRLAGEDVARSSAIRPTSREVTLYVHQDVALADLPEGIPVELTTVTRHRQDAHRNTLWIDTPDIDSVVTTHRDQVLAWLPYIDLLVYVVNPERYRDDAGWDLLKAHRHRHAWAFVINHWDRGDPAQRDDFVNVLARAAFENPAVFCTDCRDGGAPDDDFDALQAHVASHSDAVAIAAARQRSEATEQAAQAALRDACRDALGTDAAWSELERALARSQAAFAAHCETDTAISREHLLHRLFPTDPPPFWRQVLGDTDRPATAVSEVSLWTERSQSRLAGRLDELLIAASDRHLPTVPLRRALQRATEDAGVDIDGQATQALVAALEQPGTALQRAAVTLAQGVTIALPLVALVWVGWRVVQGFVSGAADETAYLGFDFLTNSAMLIALSAALPAVVAAAVRPSPRRAAQRALHRGVTAGCAAIDQGLAEQLARVKAERDRLLETL